MNTYMDETTDPTKQTDPSNPTFKERVIGIITDWHSGPGFQARKLTDTPKDANQVVPKKYVDNGFVKTNVSTAFQFASAEYDNGNITGTATINWAKGNSQYATMTGNVTLTFTNPISGGHYFLHLAGAFTPTFPSSVRWTGGTTPAATATASHKDIYTLIYSAKESLYDILQSPNYAIT